MTKLRVGIIGLGEVAQVIHLPVLQSLPELYEISAVCDISPTLLQVTGDQYGVERRYLEASEMIAANAELSAQPAHPWVSRGGVKLAGALELYPIEIEDHVCLDVGASTGGFTEVLLQNGVGRQDLGWFLDLPVIGADEPGIDRGARPRPALEQAALDQQHVHALAARSLAVVPVSQCQSDLRQFDLPVARSAASATQASNEVRSCQIS